MAKQTFTTGQVLTAAQMNSLQSNDFNQTVSVKTAAYTLVAADKGTRIEFNTSGSVTCTVNTGLFDAGDTLIIQNRGSGAVTITAGTATVNTSATLVLSQYDAGTLYFISTSAAIFFNTDAGGASPLTTKGDLFTFSTLDTRLGVGANGTVLTADSAEATGLKWATPASGGKVLQVIQATNTTQTTIATSTLTDTGLSASITPSSTSSKVLVSIVQSFYLTRLANSGQGAGISLLRGSTSILNLDGSGTNEALFIRCGLGSSSRFDMIWLVPITYLDSPSTTSSVTYKTQAGAQNTADTGSIAAQFQSSDSVMILMEIGA